MSGPACAHPIEFAGLRRDTAGIVAVSPTPTPGDSQVTAVVTVLATPAV